MELPLFPLHVVLFPGASLPLHVFEDRYRELVRVALDTDRRFGVIGIRSGVEAGGPAITYATGCIATIEQIQRSAGGSMDLLIKGESRFHLDERLPDDPYPRGRVSRLGEEVGDALDPMITAARAACHRYLSVIARIQQAEIRAPDPGVDPVDISYRLASLLDLDLAERQQLLECRTAVDRLRLLTEMARREALLLDAIGPSVGRPQTIISPN